MENCAEHKMFPKKIKPHAPQVFQKIYQLHSQKLRI